MSLSIYYTPRSRETLAAVYHFILEKFGINSANKFLLKSEKVIKLIAEHPLMFKASDIDENVRVALISKQCSLFYRATDTAIHLLFFWDNRQEPLFAY
jgi:plasmid stabilization system protein ParE